MIKALITFFSSLAIVSGFASAAPDAKPVSAKKAAGKASPKAPTAVKSASPSAEIDRLLAAGWKAAGVQPNPPASDEVLVRRLYLDIVGRIPTQDETASYLNDPAPNKRQKLVDALLDSEGYANHFFHFWADILRVNRTANNSAFVTPAYTRFLKQSLRENKPYDQFVRELLTTDGKVWESGATGYYIRDRGMPLDNMSNTVRIFLGTRLECAQCHNHPFDKWTQMDYYQMAAFSYGMDGNAYRPPFVDSLNRKLRDSKQHSAQEKRDLRSAANEILRPLRYTGITERNYRLPKLPADYQYRDAKPGTVIKPKPMFGESIELPKDASNIEAYAAWMTSKENPRFAKVIANRLWKKAFGLGLIEPIDDFSDATEASNPELLAYLEGRMKATDYDLKKFLGMIFKSRAYARAATTDEIPLGQTYHFTGPLLRRMSAEQIWDSVVTLVNPHPDRPNYAELERAAKLIDSTRKLSEALYRQTPEQFLEGAKAISADQKRISARLQEIQKELVAAKSEKDRAHLKELYDESKSLRSTLNKKVREKVYAPFMDEKDQKDAAKSGQPVIAIDGNTDGMMPGYDMPSPEQIEAMKKWHLNQMKAEAKERGLKGDQAKSYSDFYRTVLTNAQRAANISSPAPRGHFLREFGQSDREVIENASDEASVPQALQLLNGRVFKAVASRYSVLGQNVASAKGSQAQLDAIFLSMLSRRPTEAESAYLLPKIAERKSEAIIDTVFALLNTQQFLFIQ